jgi:geranylgeranyl reductase family protein
MFDCIIVGSGPAGGAAAYHLAKLGHGILVIEKDKLPRYKACGGGISPQIGAWFDFDFSPAISTTMRDIRFTWKLGDPVNITLQTPEPMWMVNRSVFDKFLIDQGIAKGAELRDGTTVTGAEFKGDHWLVHTDQGSIEGRYLIAADGAKGPMAQLLGFGDRKTRWAGVLEVKTDRPPEPRTFFEFGLAKNACLWSFPKAQGHSISMGNFRGNDRSTLQEQLPAFAQRLGLPNAAPNADQWQIHEHPIALWDGNQPLHTTQALLAGEAAAILDPLTAEGVRPAILSGVEAAKAIDGALKGELGSLERYSETIHRQWGDDMAWAQKLAGVFYSVPGIGYKIGIKRPSAATRMGQILCGELCYGDVATRALKRMGAGLIPGFGK